MMRCRTCLMLLLALALGACGQKGPLYLPDDAAAARATAPAAPPAAAEDDEDDGDGG